MAEYTLEWRDGQVMTQVRSAIRKGRMLAAEHLLKVADDLAPIEEGELHRSGVVSDNGGTISAVSFDRPYAVRQHEELTYRHDVGKQAKYLEQPMHTEQDTMLQIIQHTAQSELG